jgi:DNA mismatch repair ATPase MutL
MMFFAHSLQPMKRALFNAYKVALGEGGSSASVRGIWIFLHIRVEPKFVDVNVHPTKEEGSWLGSLSIVTSF